MFRWFFSLALLFIVFGYSCSPKTGRQIQVNKDTAALVPDYSLKSMWAAHPDISDPSDSIPAPLKKFYSYDAGIDVFFVHPTTFTDRTASEWNASVSDAVINEKTDKRPIMYQASVFNEFRVFAPRYRQANLRSYFTTDTMAARAFDIAYEDVKNAFRYFLKNENQGRPIILASHSQGSTHAQRLLKDFFNGSPLQQKLVVAYIVGMRIDSDLFPAIPICRDSTDTGCITGWRTYRHDYIPDFVELETGKPMVTNPITWTTENEPAPRALNRGAILQNFNKLVPAAAGAMVNDRILSVKDLRFPGSIFIRTQNLHIGDINLYYLNIRENARLRVSEYRKSSTN